MNNVGQQGISARWQRFFTHAYHHWNWPKVLGMWAVCSVVAALLSALWFTAVQWGEFDTPAKATFAASNFLAVVVSYVVLFSIINLFSAALYVVMMGFAVLWMGQFGYIRSMPYAQACRLVLITGLFPMALVLVFGRILDISPALGVMFMLVHAAWLHSTDLPAAPDDMPRD